MADLSATSILAVIGIVTAIFWCGVGMGAILNRLARHDDQIADHEKKLDEHDDALKFTMKGIR